MPQQTRKHLSAFAPSDPLIIDCRGRKHRQRPGDAPQPKPARGRAEDDLSNQAIVGERADAAMPVAERKPFLLGP